MSFNKTYEVYFSLYGKKMRTKVLAESKKEAEQKIKNKLVFYKTERITDPDWRAKQLLINYIDNLNERCKQLFKNL